MITHASTFSGIGAPEVAAEMLGWENVFHCEINPFGRRVLDYYFPKAKSYEDITRTDFSEWRDRITVLTGGFPCQPFSYAGRRRGSEDDRYLWPFMLRCIEQVRPRWFVGENVAGITTMAFPGEDVKVGEQTDLFGACDEVYEKHERYVLDEICQSLERAGYSVQPMLIPACAVGAPHRRDRVFIVAHRNDTSILGDTDCTIGNEGKEQEMARRSESTDAARGSSEDRRSNETDTRFPLHTDNEQLCEKSRMAESRQGSDCTRIRESAERAVASYTPSQRRREIYEQVQSKLADGAESFGNGRERTSADTIPQDTLHSGQLHGCDEEQGSERNIGNIGTRGSERLCSRTQRLADAEGLLPENRWRTFPSVSPVYRGNDGLPFPVDHLTIPFSEWKRESLKAYGNAIVPQVMYEIFRSIEEIEKSKRNGNT